MDITYNASSQPKQTAIISEIHKLGFKATTDRTSLTEQNLVRVWRVSDTQQAMVVRIILRTDPDARPAFPPRIYPRT